MAIDFGATAQAAVIALGPFMPFLTELAKKGGEKLTEVIAEKGGEAAWNRAKELWNKVTGRFGDDPEVTGAATMLAAKPESQQYQNILVEVLQERLKGDPTFARELQTLLGGPQGIQKMIVGDRGRIIQPKQKMEGSGIQEMRAGTEGVIERPEQRQG